MQNREFLPIVCIMTGHGECRFLTGKSFESLPPAAAHILIHEMLYNDEKTGPFPVAAFSMIMLGWTEGEQYSGRRSGVLRKGNSEHPSEARPRLLGHRSGSEAVNPWDAYITPSATERGQRARYDASDTSPAPR